MKNHEIKNEPSFQGKGKILIQYHNFYKDLSPMNQLTIRAFLMFKGLGRGDAKTHLLEKKFMTDAGDLTFLPPKRVVITDGEGIFNEELIQNADFVFQKGGELEKKLTAKEVTLAGGKHQLIEADNVKIIGKQDSDAGEIIVEKDLKVRNTETNNSIAVFKKAEYINSKNTGPLNFAEKLIAKGKTEISNADFKNGEFFDESVLSKSSVSGKLSMYDFSEATRLKSVGSELNLHGQSKASDFTVYGTTNINDSATAEKLVIWNDTKIKGSDHKITNLKVNNSTLKVEGFNTEINDSYANRIEGAGSVKFNNITTQNATFGDFTEVIGLNNVGNLILKDSAKASKVDVGLNVFVKNNATLEKAFVQKNIETINSAIIIDCESKTGSILAQDRVTVKYIKAPMIYLRGLTGQVNVYGTVQGKIGQITPEVKLKKDFKLDEAARKSLPWYRFRAKYMPSHRMKV